MKIDIKNLEFIDPKLREISTWLEKTTGLEFTVTSLYRVGDHGVHGCIPLRGVDLRLWSHAAGRLFESMINEKFQYDPERPEKKCAVFHDVGKGIHLHIQTHPNTKEL